MTYLNQFYNDLHAQIIKLCHSLRLRKYDLTYGSKLFDNYQRVAILILYIRSGKSLRIFCKEFSESKWRHWLQLKKLPQKSTLHDWLGQFNLDFIRELIKLSISELNPEILAIDGSGIEAQYKSAHYKKRIKFKETHSSWHKLDIVCDTQGKKQILDFSFLTKNQHDSKVAEKLFGRLKYKRAIIVADKGYFSFKHKEKLKSKEIDLIFPPKDYGKTTHNSFKHKRIIETYNKYLDLYHKRNIVESVFSSLKRVQGLRIRAKLHFMKKREMAWQILWYNLRKSISALKYLVQNIFSELYFFTGLNLRIAIF